MRTHLKQCVLCIVAMLLLTGSTVSKSQVLAQGKPGSLFLPYLPSGQTQTATEETTGPNEEPVDEESPLPEESYVRLPDYTEEELRAMRGIPLFPEDPDTLYLPPGVATLQDLPVCGGPEVVDDPTTEVNEVQVQHQQWLRDGTYERNAKVRVISCRAIPDPADGFSMTVEEYDRWCEQNGCPIIPDPAFDHPDGRFYNQPESSTTGDAPVSAASPSANPYVWAQYDLLSPSSPDLTFSALRADMIYNQPTVSGGAWGDTYGQFTRIHVGHNSAAHCSGWGLDKILVGVGMGKWHASAPSVQAAPRVAIAYNTSWSCGGWAYSQFPVYDGDLLAFEIRRYSSQDWYVSVFYGGTWIDLWMIRTDWNNNYSRRIVSGWQIFAANEQWWNVHLDTPGLIFHNNVDIPYLSPNHTPWAEQALPSSPTNYRGRTQVTYYAPFYMYPRLANMDSYNSMMVE